MDVKGAGAPFVELDVEQLLMDENLKRKYELLKKKKQEELQKNSWKRNTMFCEFIEKLPELEFVPEEKAKEIVEQIDSDFPLSIAGHIDSEKVDCCREIVTYEELENYVCLENYYYIIWDDSNIPIVKCKLRFIKENVDDLEAVSFSFLLVSEIENSVFESKKFGELFFYTSSQKNKILVSGTLLNNTFGELNKQ